jgi:hypothetical protein
VLVAGATHGPHVLVVVAHGWNIDEESPLVVLEASTPLTLRLRGWGLERGGFSWVGLAEHTVGS